MGHRAGISIFAILLALISVKVSALGLGGIALKSNLNQPLRAEIELLEARDLTRAEILVSLASEDDFDRIGVDRIYFLTDLRFDVDFANKSGPVIRVSSKKLVREPYLNFVVLVQWPSGKLLREYTVLMDLPVFADQAPAQVRAPSSSGSSSSGTYNPSSSTSSSSSQSSQANPRSSFGAGRQTGSAPSYSTSQSTQSSSYSSGDQYTIRSNDTLWEIALAVRPDRDVSVHQAMVSLKQANPDAFINNNINLLKRGQILRIPSRDEMASRSKRQAANDFAQQANIARNSRQDDVSAAPLEGRSSYSSREESSAEAEGRVKLSSPDELASSNAGSSSGSENNTSVQALEGELSATMEELDKTSLENSELKSKVSSLEEQIKTMERMIEVSNENMRALELASQKAIDEAASAEEQLAAREAIEQEQAAAEKLLAESEALVEESMSETSDVVDDAMESVTSSAEAELAALEENATEDAGLGDLADESPIDESTIDEKLGDMAETVDSKVDELVQSAEEKVDAITGDISSQESSPVAEETPKPVVAAPPKKSKGLMSVLMDNLVYIGVGLLALLGLVFVLVKKVFNKDEIDDEDEDFLSPRAYEEDHDEFESDGFGSDEEGLALGTEESGGAVEDEYDGHEEGLEDESYDEGEPSSEPQTEDVVAEADIYIAYGKYDQAEDMLVKSLDSAPTFHDARLKLLETYAAQQNVEGFDPHFAKIIATGADELISKAEQLRSTIMDAPSFSSSDFDTRDFEALLGDGDATGGDAYDNSSDTVVNFRGNVAAETNEIDAEVGELDLEGLDLDSPDLDSDSSDGDANEFDSNEFDLGSDDSVSLDLDDTLSMDSLSDDAGDALESASSLDDSDDFDLGDLHLTDDLDDEIQLDSDSSGDGDLDIDLGDIESSFDVEESVGEKADTQSDEEFDLGESLDFDDSDLSDLDLSGVSDKADAIGESDTLVLDVDESLKDLAEAGSREDEALKVAKDATAELAPSSKDDSLSLDDDLDLSSLDEELEALSKDLDGEFDEGSLLKELDDEDLSAEEVAAKADDLDLDDLSVDELSAKPSANMEEPITEFDEADSDALDIESDDTELGIDAISAGDDLGSEDDFLLPDIDPEGSDDDLDFLSDSDETATKLDLARAYIDMGDADGAKDILDEILKEGNAQHKKEAESLMARIDD